jgi:hypothetical protein
LLMVTIFMGETVHTSIGPAPENHRALQSRK